MAELLSAADWDFRGADTKQMTHCFHPYPAMMIPQVAGRLIDAYGRKARTLLDPYCGSGTSLVEANLRDINAVGSDLNPLARLISSAKTAKVSPTTIRRLERTLGEIDALLTSGKVPDAKPPELRNIDSWFPRPAQRRLAALKFQIDRVGGGLYPSIPAGGVQ